MFNGLVRKALPSHLTIMENRKTLKLFDVIENVAVRWQVNLHTLVLSPMRKVDFHFLYLLSSASQLVNGQLPLFLARQINNDPCVCLQRADKFIHVYVEDRINCLYIHIPFTIERLQWARFDS